jgi:hypothetical protein
MTLISSTTWSLCTNVAVHLFAKEGPECLESSLLGKMNMLKVMKKMDFDFGSFNLQEGESQDIKCVISN